MTLKSIDLIDEVVDVKWSPFSSTTFGIICKDGRLELWDIQKKNFDPIFSIKNTEEIAVARTSLVFSKSSPIVLIGRADGKIDVYQHDHKSAIYMDKNAE